MCSLAFVKVAATLAVLLLPCATSKKLKLVELEKTLDFGTNAGGSGHPCFRECDGEVMHCHYNLTLSMFATMSTHCGDCPRRRDHCSRPGCISAGGISRPVFVGNLMLPGPGLHVCAGDLLTVRVENAFPTEGATVHWHGQWVTGQPHMDGVPYVSQCPILPSNAFEYTFTAHPAGTHMWHAHVGLLETDGLFGPLVVRQPRADEAHAGLYDEDLVEHTLAIWHWYPNLSGSYLPVSLFRNESIDGAGILVNGKGVMGDPHAPVEEVRVQQGKRYRLRLLFNSAVFCPVQFSIDNHTMMAIASDGANFKPIEVESLMLNAGERWDVVVRADQPVDRYWVRLRGTGDCGETKSRVFQHAVLVYEGSNADAPAPPRPTFSSSQRQGKILNPMDRAATDFSDNELVQVTDLENIDDTVHGNISEEPDHVFYVVLDMVAYDGLVEPNLMPQNNRVSFENPAVPMILQRYDKDGTQKCSAEDVHKHCVGSYCSCPLTEKIALGSLVEMVLVDLSWYAVSDHPYHIHGTNFHVVAEGFLGRNVSLELVKSLNQRGLISKRLSSSAPLKDTVTVPSLGYAVVRFRAINPGYWFFHCHISMHVHLGMGLVLQVGEDSEMPAVPSDFPRCGNWAFSEESNAAMARTSPASWTLLVFIGLLLTSMQSFAFQKSII